MTDGIRTDHLDELGPAADAYIGKTLGGRYRVVRKIGDGGMGSVYEAEHLLIGRRVAVKLLHAQFASQADVVKRFMNEARAAAMIGHPNILECTDMGSADDGSPFLVLALLTGQDLEALIDAEGPLTLGRTVRIALQIVSALSAAHAKQIVHRDLKPENVFLIRNGDNPDHVKVLDFGISKFASAGLTGPATKTGSVLGTPYYMAPEQLRDSSRVDARADVYALGTILYQCLSKRVPFNAATLPELILKIVTEEPVPIATLRPDLPEAVTTTIDRALAKDASARFSSMDELGAALRPYVDVESAPVIDASDVDPLGATHSAPSFSSTPMATETKAQIGPKSRVPLVLGSVLMLVLLGGTAGWTAMSSDDREAAGRVAELTPSPPAEAPADVRPPPAIDEHPVGEVAPQQTQVRVRIDSPQRGGRVTVRGREHPLPFDTMLDAGDGIELIEVRAPRREGRRFRLTIDQTRDLWVELPRGRGHRDATPRELAAALSGTSPAGRRRRPRETQETPSPMEQAQNAIVAPMVAIDPAPDPPSMPASMMVSMSADGVYRGPTGDIPDSI